MKYARSHSLRGCREHLLASAAAAAAETTAATTAAATTTTTNGSARSPLVIKTQDRAHARARELSTTATMTTKRGYATREPHCDSIDGRALSAVARLFSSFCAPPLPLENTHTPSRPPLLCARSLASVDERRCSAAAARPSSRALVVSLAHGGRVNRSLARPLARARAPARRRAALHAQLCAHARVRRMARAEANHLSSTSTTDDADDADDGDDEGRRWMAGGSGGGDRSLDCTHSGVSSRRREVEERVREAAASAAVHKQSEKDGAKRHKSAASPFAPAPLAARHRHRLHVIAIVACVSISRAVACCS